MFFNSVLQLIFSIFRNNSYISPFNSSTEGALLKCFFFQTAQNACNSKEVDAFNYNYILDETLSSNPIHYIETAYGSS